jgi:hypothetical protein
VPHRTYMKINAIILSLGRKLYTDLLLNSIEKNAKDIFDIKVLSEKEDFKRNLIDSLNLNNKLTCFFTDNDILFDNIDLETIEQSLNKEDVFCFSLRLGKNVSYCYNAREKNQLVISNETDNTILVDWQKSWYDFGSPLSINGHIFRTKDILKLTKPLNFFDPEHYEESLQIYETFPRNMMESYNTSKLVTAFYSEETELKFLSDGYIDLERLDFSNMDSASRRIDYKKEILNENN